MDNGIEVPAYTLSSDNKGFILPLDKNLLDRWISFNLKPNFWTRIKILFGYNYRVYYRVNKIVNLDMKFNIE